MSKANRLKLHNELKQFINNVYFQPPESVKMSYPCIVYSRSTDFERQANNRHYVGVEQYDLTIIGHKPDSELAEELREHFPMCSITQHYVADNLQHTKLRLYY